MSVLRTLVKNPVKKSFYGKGKKKTNNILTVFLFPIKVMSKFFKNELLTSTLRALVSITLLIFVKTNLIIN